MVVMDEVTLHRIYTDFVDHNLAKFPMPDIAVDLLWVDTADYYELPHMRKLFRNIKKKHNLVTVKQINSSTCFLHGYLYGMKHKDE